MTTTEILTTFAALFVKKSFRTRFLHEALKRPQRLHSRICHRITEVFPDDYKDCRVHFMPDAKCLLLDWSPAIHETTWAEAAKQIGMGGGLLIIEASGRKFYAETEGEPKSDVWGGAS
jgi:hypothetical protein